MTGFPPDWELPGQAQVCPREGSSTQNKGLLFLIPTKCPLGLAAAHISAASASPARGLSCQEPTTWSVPFISTWSLPAEHGWVPEKRETHIVFFHCYAEHRVVRANGLWDEWLALNDSEVL